MLSKLKIFSFTNIPLNITRNRLFLYGYSTHTAGKKNYLTKQHIDRSNNLSQLLTNLQTIRLTQNRHFQPFMHKLTALISKSQKLDKKTLYNLEQLIFQIRRHSSAEIHSNPSDLMNYNLFFKQIKDIFSKDFHGSGFEYRVLLASQTLPVTASFSRWDPIAIALLHYMSTVTQLSKEGIKKNILNYFLRYMIDLRKAERQRIIERKNQSFEKTSDSPSKFQQTILNVYVAIIILSCSESRTSKNTLQDMIDTISMSIFSRNIAKVCQALHIKNIVKLYYSQFSKRDNSNLNSQEVSLIKQTLSMDNNLKEYQTLNMQDTQGVKKPLIVINDQISFLQSVDIFLNFLNKSKLNLVKDQNIQLPNQIFHNYFYMVLLVSQDMKIWVTKKQQNALLDKQLQEQLRKLNRGKIDADELNKQGKQVSLGKGQLKQIKLWKILSLILEEFAKNNVYIQNKQKTIELALDKMFSYLKKNITLAQIQTNSQIDHQQEVKNSNKKDLNQTKDYEASKNMKKQKASKKAKHSKQIKQDVKGFEASIVKFLTYLPVQSIKSYESKNKKLKINQYIVELMKICMKNLGTNQKQESTIKYNKQVISNVIKLMELKKSLLISKKEWVSILKTIINEDENLSYWDLYFSLASTQDPALIKLIPIRQLAYKIVEQRKQMDSRNQYVEIKKEEVVESKASFEKIQKNSESQKSRLGNLSRQWQISVLRLQALLILCQKYDQLVKILEQVNQKQSQYPSNYKLGQAEIQRLFSTWVSPFDHKLLSQMNQSYDKTLNKRQMDGYKMAKNQSQNQDITVNLGQSIRNRYFSFRPIPYYAKYFEAIFIQTGVFYQLNLINKILTHPIVQNHILYVQRESIQNFIWYFVTIVFGIADPHHKSTYMNKYSVQKIVSNDFRISAFFKSNLQNLVNNFYLKEQFKYLFDIINKKDGIHVTKDVYMQVIFQQQLYKTAAVQNNFDKQKYLSTKSPMRNVKNARKRKISEQENQQIMLDQIQFIQKNVVNLDPNPNSSSKCLRLSKQCYNYFIKTIVDSSINDLSNPKNFSKSNMIRLLTLSNFLKVVAYLNCVSKTSTPAQNISEFLTRQQKINLQNAINKTTFKYYDSLSLAVFNLDMLNLFTAKNALHLLNTLKKPNDKIDSLLLICYEKLGKEQIIERKFITQQKWQNLQAQIFLMSSIMKYNYSFLVFSVRYGTPAKTDKLLYLLKKIRHPIERRIFVEQFKKFQNRYKLNKINIQQLQCSKQFQCDYSTSLNDWYSDKKNALKYQIQTIQKQDLEFEILEVNQKRRNIRQRQNSQNINFQPDQINPRRSSLARTRIFSKKIQ